MDINILDHLKNLDPVSLLVGAAALDPLKAVVRKVISPLPRLAVQFVKNRLKALAAAGKLDAPTMSFLKTVGKAAFKWMDDEMPDKPGPEKMDALIVRLGAIPLIGLVVRTAPMVVREILQIGYDAINAEAKAQGADAAAPAKVG